MTPPPPEAVLRLFWDVDPEALERVRHRDYIMERVMSRGDWSSMVWLRDTYSKEDIRDFLARKASRLSPRDAAYWAFVSGAALTAEAGGGRPKWAGP